ncbi:nitroreductase family deazaflavin-dependent oxidoreductase [Nocardioides terrisoli]|uniref:nitroreductase family deazaflavin-dependent oxidoreductase n=1 Tax=Nocardioides terrisoli TaxID=3388267 RepID=UPI00287B96B6|nr:nitroreductase family deazaflavin-dependent oxidoreductase [Nocardioides marmorisolisilvae]
MTDQKAPSPIAHIAAVILRTRCFVRAPILLYRARLGFLLGGRLLMLEHRGRKTGRRRYVVLEVVDRSGDEYTVAAGFGERAQWLHNLDAHPQARISIGRQVRLPVVARRLTDAEVQESLRRYALAHPRAWRSLAPVFEQTLGAPISTTGTTLPMVRLVPAEPRPGLS